MFSAANLEAIFFIIVHSTAKKTLLKFTGHAYFHTVLLFHFEHRIKWTLDTAADVE